MNAKKAGSAKGLPNDDIGQDVRLDLYRLQVKIRDAEKRANDLFFQNLIKGTSHLSLGQEAIAAGMAVAMEPLAEAELRIREKTFGPITSFRRLGSLGAG